MKALSIKQPWSYLICAGHKDIENRDWPTRLRGRVYVHAGKKVDQEGAIWLWQSRNKLGICECPLLLDWTGVANTWNQSAIIGEVDIVDCLTESASIWFTGNYGLVLANPVLYDKPIPCKGKLGFFKPVTSHPTPHRPTTLA